ncbi:MAG: DinB family protein [Chthonomonadaceae bacterium]|nr:DinB family protein [Chthonomonadaceae bacterium]
MEKLDIIPVEDTEPQIGLLLAMLEDGTREWVEELGEVSVETLTWSPFPNGHSIGAILLHIADVEAYWISEIGSGKLRTEEQLKILLSRETDQFKVEWPTPPSEPLSWYLKRIEEVREQTRQLVKTWHSPSEIILSRGNEYTKRWLLYHVLTHEAYHGGQMVLLSLMPRP